MKWAINILAVLGFAVCQQGLVPVRAGEWLKAVQRIRAYVISVMIRSYDPLQPLTASPQEEHRIIEQSQGTCWNDLKKERSSRVHLNDNKSVNTAAGDVLEMSCKVRLRKEDNF